MYWLLSMKFCILAQTRKYWWCLFSGVVLIIANDYFRRYTVDPSLHEKNKVGKTSITFVQRSLKKLLVVDFDRQRMRVRKM